LDRVENAIEREKQFTSDASHELRTPLTSIRASLGLLEGGIAGTLDDEALQLVEIARAESERLILLINDILDLRKIEAGKLELKLRQVQLSELVDSLIESLRAMADEFDVTLKAHYEKDWSFVADRERIIQVIHNLLSNAIKYSYKSGKVDVIVEKKDVDQLRFSVIDRGPGIRADQIHKLFGKFQQLDSSDSRPKGGTGLGLAISKAIVEQHGGSVGVNSKPGEGSTFWFELPMTLDAAASLSAIPATVKRTVEKQKPKLPARVRSAGPATVLIVEDDKSTLELMTKQLERLGIACLSAEDGSSAVDILQKTRPDLLILDITVPAPNGFALVNILKKSDQHNLPLLVYTSLDLSESDKQQLTLGKSKHLIKSITSQEDLVAAVKELLGNLIKEHDKKS
ncbi:MAG: hybrid sensor histidine kinase/response regulator, partial [Candidatus Obscuribacterales bacterium]|nr:hybrid sensor histidine kinase/response regulator [Candidatus Obscuribacterales bacterium]